MNVLGVVMTDNKSLEEQRGRLRREVQDAIAPPSVHPTLGALRLGDNVGLYQTLEFTIMGTFAGATDRLIDLIENRRKADIHKISFHFGIPVRDLIAALASKDNVKERI